MPVTTWNVNLVLKRIDQTKDWLERTQPDVLTLQELEMPTAPFAAEAFSDTGYACVVVGHQGWNGVTLLAGEVTWRENEGKGSVARAAVC